MAYPIHTASATDSPRQSRLLLAADVGGTHARIGLVDAGPGHDEHVVTAYHKYVCADWPDLQSILDDFVTRHGVGETIHHAALACAGYAIDGEVINTNLPWPISIRQLHDALQLDQVDLVNDFEALACAIGHASPQNATALAPHAHGNPAGLQLVIGPGTGLGAAVLLPGAPRHRVLATEAGQISLAPGNQLERDLLEIFARDRLHVPVEHVLSGPGLLNLYRALCQLQGNPAPLATPSSITELALQGSDAVASQTLHVFCGILGSFVGDLCLMYGADGGVWLAGGILPKIRSFLQSSDFVERFLAKGHMRPFLQRIPVKLIEHGRLGVIGASVGFAERHWLHDSGSADDSPPHPPDTG